MNTSSILKLLDLELIPKGFRRKRYTWNRDHGSLVDVIDVQVSSSFDAVTINVGVLSRSVYFSCWGEESKLFVQEPDCTVRARIGDLLEENVDRWWDIGSEGTAEEMVELIKDRISPFLDRMRSFDSLLEWLASKGIPNSRRPVETVYFALLHVERGDTSVACSVLAELSDKALGAWKQRAKVLGLRIGCDLSRFTQNGEK